MEEGEPGTAARTQTRGELDSSGDRITGFPFFAFKHISLLEVVRIFAQRQIYNISRQISTYKVACRRCSPSQAIWRSSPLQSVSRCISAFSSCWQLVDVVVLVAVDISRYR